MNSLLSFMPGTWGRLLRIALGLLLIYVGLVSVGGAAGIVVAVIGVLPIVMGVWGPCLLGFIFKSSKG